MSWDFSKIFRVIMQSLSELISGLVRTRSLLVNINIYNAYKSVLITIKKILRLPKGFPYTFTITNKAFRPSQLLFNLCWIFTSRFYGNIIHETYFASHTMSF